MRMFDESTTLQTPLQTIEQADTPRVFEYEVEPITDTTGRRYGYIFAKRVMDIVLSFVALVLLSPLFLLIAIAVKIDSRGPVVFKQTRVGKDGKHFTMYKIRSMFTDAEERLKDLLEQNERTGPVFKIKEDPRVTKVGKFIRKTCIDELPQLVNVLKGDMSIVGPRPLFPKDVLQYTPRHMLRMNVPQGLTCFWQISDRDVTFDEWVEMDIRYINERCLALDFALMYKTLRVVVKQNGDK